jgi:hypothetical protein
MDESKFNRQITLRSYGFNCDCIACEKNFPTFERENDGPLVEYAGANYYNNVELFINNELTPTIAKRLIKEYFSFMIEKSKSGSYAKDYFMLHKSVLLCLDVIATNEEKIP